MPFAGVTAQRSWRHHRRGRTTSGGAIEIGVGRSRCHMVPRSNWITMPSGEKMAPWFQPSAQMWPDQSIQAREGSPVPSDLISSLAHHRHARY